MKKLAYSLIAFVPLASWAISLKDYQPFKYEVLFTNPVCKTYSYDKPLKTNGGKLVSAKPKNAYCKSSDSYNSGKRKNAPLRRLKDWIRNDETKEIFLAYLSFSQGSVVKELCNAIEKRNVKVTLVIDNKNEGDENRMRQANKLANCRPNKKFKKPNLPLVKTSGHSGRGKNKTGYAHNKLFFVNPKSKGAVKIAFSSGNMSSGVTTHHENWHFVETSNESYFAQAHSCLMKGVLNHDSSIKDFSDYVTKCRKSIDVAEEDDIKTFFVPGEGDEALAAIAKAMKKAMSVDMAAHRFSYGSLIKLIEKNLRDSTDFRLVVDDDIYWTGKLKKGVGRNSLMEYGRVNFLRKQGMKVQYMETYADDVDEPRSLQLQHNKFLVFNNGNNHGAVFAGAGNLTGSAFKTNFENFYLISIPEVYQAFKKQYAHMWNELSTSYKNMPTTYVLP